MPKYLFRASYKSEGIKGLAKDKATGRRVGSSKMVEAAGGKLETLYFAFGEDDVVGIVDMPDNVTAAAISVAVNAAGYLHSSLTPLLTAEEMDAALAKSVNYRAPGG